MNATVAPEKNSTMPERTQTHAAPTELGGLCGTCGYKHGAPNGAFLNAVTSPPYERRV